MNGQNQKTIYSMELDKIRVKCRQIHYWSKN